jgi:hypothetical protein
MNTERFQKSGDGFDVLDLRARFVFKTPSSIGFRMIMRPNDVATIGALQVHHPCLSYIKARIYFQLPMKYCDDKSLVAIGMQAFRELEIPQDETYEFVFDCSETGLIVMQPVDRDGNPGGVGSYA